MRSPFRQVQIGLAVLALIMIGGTVGYVLLGFSLLDAVFQTVETVSTVGFGLQRPLGQSVKIFTIILILVGVGTALYTFTSALELLIEGHMRQLVRRRRMDREISRMTGHVVVCGWGRVGREVARYLAAAGRQVVVVDRDDARLVEVQHPTVHGDVTEDETLFGAGVPRAGTVVAALDTDADNLFVTVASKSMNPDVQVIARARSDTSEPKLIRAGADRVVNPQRLGADRMAAFVTQPHVVDFIDVVMHDGSLEFRLEEISVTSESPLRGKTLWSAHLHDRTGALVLAIRRGDGSFVTNPSPGIAMDAGDVLISVGTENQLQALDALAGQGATSFN